MAVETRISDLIADFAYRLLTPRLRCFVRCTPGFGEFLGELDPIRLIDRDRLAILAPTPRRQHQRRRLRESNSGIIDKLPS